jgi:hypothetical protein
MAKAAWLKMAMAKAAGGKRRNVAEMSEESVSHRRRRRIYVKAGRNDSL